MRGEEENNKTFRMGKKGGNVVSNFDPGLKKEFGYETLFFRSRFLFPLSGEENTCFPTQITRQ